VSVELTEARGLAHVGLGHLKRDRFSMLAAHAVPLSQDQFVGGFAPGVRPHAARVGAWLGAQTGQHAAAREPCR
jgi:hypothetical protein